jgi:hypothetical protein
LLVVCPRLVQSLRVFGGEVIECDLLVPEKGLKDVLVPDDTQYLEQYRGCDNPNDQLADEHL